MLKRRAASALSWHFLSIVLPLVGCVAIAAFIVLVKHRADQASEDMAARAESITIAYANAINTAMWNLDYVLMRATLESLGNFPSVSCASVQSFADGTNIAWNEAACRGAAVPGHDMMVPIQVNDKPIGKLTIRFKTDDAERVTSGTLFDYAVFTLLLMAAVVASAAFALRRAVGAPLGLLTADMLTLSGGDTNIRIVGQDRRDAIGDMARALAKFREDKILADRMAADLASAQTELIEQGKLASLGSIVAGVAHEVNTPIGVSVTAMSKLVDAEEHLSKQIEDGSLTEEEFNDFVALTRQVCKITTANLDRAAHLIKSFKGIAVDQTSEQPRRIELGRYLEEILTSLRPEVRKSGHRVELTCPEPIELETTPAAIWQIVSNLVLNACNHAFEEGVVGAVRVEATTEDGMARISVRDNGRGMSEEVRARVFEPFFTTRRGSGGSGLGLTIVYNLVASTLAGKIACMSHPGRGTRFVVTFPLRRPETTGPVIAGAANAAAPPRHEPDAEAKEGEGVHAGVAE